MSNQTAGTSTSSTDSFSAIFHAALTEYQRTTRKRLDTHPFSTQLNACESPQAVSNVLRTQAQAFNKIRQGDERLMDWLNPIVHILFVFSGTLGEGIGLIFSPAKIIFTGIGVLLAAVKDVVASHDKLINLFERIHFFLQRLDSYTGIPLTHGFTELLGKIMAQTLSILALSTKAMVQRRIKTFLKRLVGRTNVEDALLRLDSLTKEECLMAVARNLVLSHAVVSIVKNEAREIKRNQFRSEFRRWLSPPDPSINHNTACGIQHDGTARWFINGSTFREWKEPREGSLLWIRGNPGAGKSILCSAIIEDIMNMREAQSALIAYHYFDFKDSSKRDIRGLLTSLLFQLGDDSNLCWDALHRLYTKCRDGSEQPSDAALVGCLETMLELPGQVPIYVILDALDECPSTTGTPSAREKVLDFVEALVGSNHSNLFICITSRPEQDIQTVLNPLTSTRQRVSLHEEHGQREDIELYIRDFVCNDRKMMRWREDDKELVINTLSERANGMWAFCQLDTLRRCMPSSLRKALDELPTSLDDTYKRALEGIPKEQHQHACRIFQCLVAAIRPLRVEELAEIFAIEFDLEAAPQLSEGWRPENPGEAVLSACSTLISIIEAKGSRIVQFSHFSVKEFLTSGRLLTSEVGSIRQYHIPLDDAHTILARACLTVLLQLDEVNKKRLTTFPLAFYAAWHWIVHARFEDVASRVQDAMKHLFNPQEPFLAAWASIRDVDDVRFQSDADALPKHSLPPGATALYYAALCGFSRLVDDYIVTHGEDVNSRCGNHGSPLHAASYQGHLEVARILLGHGADVNLGDDDDRSPLVAAYRGRNVDVMRLLLEHGAVADAKYDKHGFISHDASCCGEADIVELLLEHHADVSATGSKNWTPLYWASMQGYVDVIQLLLERGADINTRSSDGWTPLHTASKNGRVETVKLLLEHGALVDAESVTQQTPLHVASQFGRLDVVRVLLEHGADVHLRRRENNQTAFQVATSSGHKEIGRLLLEHGAEEE